MSRPTFDQMDIRKIGFVSKDEYMKLNSWKAGEEQALAAFKMMDTDNDGQVTGSSLSTVWLLWLAMTSQLGDCVHHLYIGLTDQYSWHLIIRLPFIRTALLTRQLYMKPTIACIIHYCILSALCLWLPSHRCMLTF